MLDHKVALILIFCGPSIVSSIMAIAVYSPTYSGQGFPFLHILANTCSLSQQAGPFRARERIAPGWYGSVLRNTNGYQAGDRNPSLQG